MGDLALYALTPTPYTIRPQPKRISPKPQSLHPYTLQPQLQPLRKVLTSSQKYVGPITLDND